LPRDPRLGVRADQSILRGDERRDEEADAEARPSCRIALRLGLHPIIEANSSQNE
jgi:hypothetical protein